MTLRKLAVKTWKSRFLTATKTKRRITTRVLIETTARIIKTLEYTQAMTLRRSPVKTWKSRILATLAAKIRYAL
jgi:hypothetical protein